MTTFKVSLAALLAALTTAHFAHCEESAPKEVALDPSKLVEKLNSDDFDARDAAARELAKLGETARPALEKAFAGNDPDIKEAVQLILAKMSQSVLTVQAFDRDGKPIKDAQADAQFYDPTDIYRQQQQQIPVTTDADGLGQLPACKPGIYQVYLTWKKCQPATGNYYGGQLKLLEGRNRMLCTLSTGGTLQLNITDEDGKPIKDAKVSTVNSYYAGADLDAEAMQMMSARMGNQETKSADTDEKGSAKIEGVPQGVCQCLISHENYLPVATPLYRVHDGDTTTAETIKLKAKAPGKLQLILTKDDGKPLAKTSILVTLKRKLENQADEKKAARSAIQQRMWFGFNQQQGEPTDENGKLLKENVASGTYRLTIQTGDANGRFWRGHGRSQNEVLEFVNEEVVIKTGETTELTLKPVSGGTLTGKVLNDKGAGVSYANITAIPEADYVNAGAEAMNQYARNAYSYGFTDVRYEQTTNDGSYKFTRFKPGKYVLYVQTNNGETAIIYGVEVTDGKETAAPEVKFVAVTKSFKEVKIRVTLPGGRPAQGVNVNFATVNRNGGWSSSGNQTDADGVARHNINNYSNGAPNKVSISMPGYRPVNLDLNDPEIKPEDINVTLQVRSYHKLFVKTVDEAGKPVAGVEVWPEDQNHMYRHNFNNQNPGSRMHKTDKDGKAQFDGLIDGKRKIRVQSEGYFADDQGLTVNIGADGDTQHTIVLHPGLKLSGKLTLPEGVAADHANAVLNDHQGVTVRKNVNARGEFEFTGLAPGEYTATAEAPGCQMGCEHKQATLAKDKTAEPVAVTLIRPAGGVALLGGDKAGMHATLLPVDYWKNPDATKFWAPTNESVDSTGRAEFWAPPGSYVVSVSPNQMYVNYDPRAANTTKLSPLAGPLTVQPLKSYSEMGSLKGEEITLPKGTATFTMTIIPEAAPDKSDKKVEKTTSAKQGVTAGSRAVAYVQLLIVSKNATGWVHVNTTPDKRNDEDKPLIIGTPPAGMKVVPTDAKVTTVTDVPEGDYKIYVVQNQQQKRGEPKQSMKSIFEFSIKDGETKSLGEIKVPLPSKEEAELQQDNNEWWAAPDEDKVEEFKP
jgi:protocatechuate 3,4-dioxygenase beta subunit